VLPTTDTQHGGLQSAYSVDELSCGIVRRYAR